MHAKLDFGVYTTHNLKKKVFLCRLQKCKLCKSYDKKHSNVFTVLTILKTFFSKSAHNNQAIITWVEKSSKWCHKKKESLITVITTKLTDQTKLCTAEGHEFKTLSAHTMKN